MFQKVDISCALGKGHVYMIAVSLLFQSYCCTVHADKLGQMSQEVDIDAGRVGSRGLASVADNKAMFDLENAVPAWKGRFDLLHGLAYFTPSMVKNSCAQKRQMCSSIPGQSYPYEAYLEDPTASTGQPVMKVSYPAGSWSPGSQIPGGVLFYTYPTKLDPFERTDPLSSDGATLEYDVFLPENFEFVKGGKFPGFMGGASNGIGCGGGNKEYNCFSYRVMWRREGYGEAYVYLPIPYQEPGFCDSLPRCMVSEPSVQCNICDSDTGISLHRASFQFQRGQWNSLKLQMRLNTPNITDGMIRLTVNGNLAFEKYNVNWRLTEDVKIEGINIASWYGGSDATWAPTQDMHVYMKNFKMYYDGPTDILVRNVPAQTGPQVVINQEIDEAP